MQAVLQIDGDEAKTGQAIILDVPEFQSHQLRWLSAWRPPTLPSGGNSAHRINKDYGSQTGLRGCLSRFHDQNHVHIIMLIDHHCITRPTGNTGLIFTDMLHLGSIVVCIGSSNETTLTASGMHIRVLDCCSDLTVNRMPVTGAVFPAALRVAADTTVITQESPK